MAAIKELCKKRGILRSGVKPILVKKLYQWEKENKALNLKPPTPKTPRPDNDNDDEEYGYKQNEMDRGWWGLTSQETPRKKVKLAKKSSRIADVKPNLVKTVKFFESFVEDIVENVIDQE